MVSMAFFGRYIQLYSYFMVIMVFSCNKDQPSTVQGTELPRSVVLRLTKEFKAMNATPEDSWAIRPVGDDLSNIRFVFKGPVSTDFEGGVYFGTIKVPSDYPLKAPTLIFHTKNGVFRENFLYCMSTQEHWDPGYSLSTALLSTIAMMSEKDRVEKGHFSIGHLESSPEVRRRIAKESMEFNMNHKEFREVFGDWACKYGKTTDPENACKSWWSGWFPFKS